MIDCFVALGGNIGDTYEVMCQTVRHINNIPHVNLVNASRPFITTPVSTIKQNDFLNAALHLQTTLDPHALFDALEQIEILMGKQKKERDAPRIIDIDLLTFGDLQIEDERLTLPHPRFLHRLFVLAPLADIATHLPHNKDNSLQSLLSTFENINNERVVPLEISLLKLI